MARENQYQQNERGSFIVPLGIAIIVLLGVTFYAMDMGLLFKARNQLQTATDAAVTRALQLINSNPNPTEDELLEMEHLAELSGVDNLAMFYDTLNITNWSPDSEDSPITVTINPDTHHIVAEGRITVDTWVYDALAGEDWSTVVDAQAEGNRKRLIVAILVDRSQSMDNVVEECGSCYSTCIDDSGKSGKCSGNVSFNFFGQEHGMAALSWAEALEAEGARSSEGMPIVSDAPYLRGDYPEDENNTSGKSGAASGSGKKKTKISTSGGKGHKSFESKSIDIGHQTVCHHPGGDASKKRTLRVGADAVAAHLAHGDTLGNCSGTSCSASAKCDGVSKLEAAKLVAESLVSRYKDRIDLLLMFEFEEEAEPMLVSELAGLKAKGGTDIHDAIDEAKEDMVAALADFGDDAYLQMVIITDGVPGDGEVDTGCTGDLSTATAYDKAPYMIKLIDFADELREEPGVRIFTIGVGIEAPVSDTDQYQDRFDPHLVHSVFLRRLAADPLSADDPPFNCTEKTFDQIRDVNPGRYIHAKPDSLDSVSIKFGEELMTLITK